MIGSPDTGKTMLARRLPTVLPALTLAESLETTRIYSVLGRLKPDEPLLATRAVTRPLTRAEAFQVCKELNTLDPADWPELTRQAVRQSPPAHRV